MLEPPVGGRKKLWWSGFFHLECDNVGMVWLGRWWPENTLEAFARLCVFSPGMARPSGGGKRPWQYVKCKVMCFLTWRLITLVVNNVGLAWW